MTSDLRKAMGTALKDAVLPVLRARGFKGSLPHLRRPTPEAIELLTFQFDKWGGGFIVEIARCAVSGFTTHWGEHIPPGKVSAWDMHPRQRHRIQAKEGSGTAVWFRFDQGQVALAAQEFLSAMPEAESWWLRQAQQGAPADSPPRVSPAASSR